MPRNHRALRFIEKIGMRTTADMYEWLSGEAGRQNVSMAEVMRLALEHYRAYVEAEMAD